MKKLILLFSCVLVLNVFIPLAFAQGGSAVLSGTVTDPTGAAIPAAHVTFTNVDTNLALTSQSNSSGLYRFPTVPPGHYTLAAEGQGFQKFQQSGIVITVSQQATIDIALKVGSETETISVQAGAALINTTNAEIANTVGEHAIRELPLNGRDPSSLVLLSPGTVNVLNTGAGTLQGETTFPNETGASSGGGRQGSTLYLLDGVPNMDTYLALSAPSPNSDATGEFRVISNNFDAHYGFSPGAVVSIDTKGGSNAFHGGVFEFLRNNALNSADYFSKKVDSLKRNQFGGFLGGPIKRDRLFFFGNYQGTRQSTTATSNSTNTPTAAMLNGDFSAYPKTLTGGFVNNRIDPALFNPAALRIARTALPQGQDPASGLVYYTAPPTVERYDEGTGRLDYSPNERHRLTLRSFIQYYNKKEAAVPGNILAITPGKQGKFFNEVVNHTWTINPSTVNALSLFWNQMHVYNAGTQLDSNGDAFCLSKFVNVSDPTGTCYSEGLNANGGFSTPYSEYTGEMRRSWGFSDYLTKIRGNHTFSFGADLWHQRAREQTYYPAAPIVSFNGYSTGFGLADFLLGRVYTYTQGAGEIADVSGNLLGAYAQDQWRARPNLTLTLGIRWDPNLAPTSKDGRGAVYNPGQQSTMFANAPNGLVFPGDRGVPDSLATNTYGYWEPRIAVAYQASPRTAFRAGFGLFTAPLPYSAYNHVADVAPFSPTFTLNGSSTNPIDFSNPWANFPSTGGVSPFPPFVYEGIRPSPNYVFPSVTTVPAAFRPNFKLGMTQSWNVSVEQQFSNDLVMHLAYVGSQSYHQTLIIDANPGQTSAAVRGQRALTNYNQILTINSNGTASYHSLQAQFEKRFSHNFQAQTSFTWSKNIDIAASGNASFTGNGIANPYDLGFNRGLSDVNVPFVSVTNAVYTTPALRGRNTLVRSVVGEWEISAIYTMQSGQPFSVSGGNGNNNSGALINGDRADFVPGVVVQTHQGSKQQWLNQYFTTAAFQQNASGTFGNSGRNILKGPGINYSDAAVMKNWTLHEHYKAQFRWEFFNAFNHANFGQPDANPSSGTYGRITATGPIKPRVMQAGLKLTF
ncbi:MAG TPA: carboxypeptidase regulatory-like domain-containing protein [Edaphobacter sp.]|nr:carboxypeptidase regulatory-like domain-containing protein [Edaphobacter sp.]